MVATLGSIVLRLALCAVAVGLAWWWIGPVGFALTAPLFGVALARPLLDLLSQSRAAVRERAYSAIEGRFYAFKGVPIDVIEGDDGHRWLRLADVRRVIEGLASDAVLAKAHPDGVMRHGTPPRPYIQDDALLAQLARAMAPATVRFRLWVERDIVFPARHRRGERTNMGSRSRPADPTLPGASEPDSTPRPTP